MNYFPTILEPKGSVSFLLVLSFFFPFPFFFNFLFVFFFFQWFLRVEQENFNLSLGFQKERIVTRSRLRTVSGVIFLCAKLPAKPKHASCDNRGRYVTL